MVYHITLNKMSDISEFELCWKQLRYRKNPPQKILEKILCFLDI